MMSFSVHNVEVGHFIAFTIPSLVDKIQKAMDTRCYSNEDRREYEALIWLFTNRSHWIPGYSYLLTCYKIDGVFTDNLMNKKQNSEVWCMSRTTLVSCRSSEEVHCCCERTCPHNMVMGIDCPVHGNHDFGVVCKQGACDPGDC